MGRAFALALAGAGAAVAVSSRTESDLRETVRLVQDTGGRAVAVPADALDAASVERMVGETIQQLGPIDLLVNNPGIYGTAGPIAHVAPDDWWHTIEGNLRTRFLCARAVLPGMIERRRGRIVNMGSSAGTAPAPNLSAYACAYAALLRFTDTLAAEVKDAGIAVFSISPGAVQTDTVRWVTQSPTWQRWAGNLAKTFAEGRGNPPDRAAGLVVFLASGRADALSGRHVAPSIMQEIATPGHTEHILEHDLLVLRFRR